MKDTFIKFGIMQETFDQIQTEVKSWKRWLDFFKEENIYLKNTLSEVLKNGITSTQLEEFENFQTTFIEQDELAKLIKNDISELSTFLGETNDPDVIYTKVNNLRHNIQTLQKKFFRLQSAFNEYLSKKIK